MRWKVRVRPVGDPEPALIIKGHCVFAADLHHGYKVRQRRSQTILKSTLTNWHLNWVEKLSHLKIHGRAFHLSIFTCQDPSGIIPHGEISWPHTISAVLEVGVRSEMGVEVERGLSVRARGLCDISRLPIWLGEWTPSNYSCSYCLINLPVSLLHPQHTLTISPRSLLQRRGKKHWVAWRHKTQPWKVNEIIQDCSHKL